MHKCQIEILISTPQFRRRKMKGKAAITTVFAVISAIAALFVFPLPVGAAGAGTGLRWRISTRAK